MILEDEYGSREQGTTGTAAHSLKLRPNTKEEFDVDIIKLDSRLGTDEENDPANGVENGMGLYQFELPEMVEVVSVDNTQGATNRFEPGWKDALIYMLNDYDDPDLTATATLDTSIPRVFSNATSADTSRNLTGKPVLSKDTFTNEDGVVKHEVYTSAYVWDDYKLNYYPCSGVTQAGTHYLRDLDRVFSKFDQGLKITKLNLKDKEAQLAPLGVWRYKYVWDFGNGIYSAPSTELLCPDNLWSAVNDTDLLGGSSSTLYERGRQYQGEDFSDQHLPQQAPYTDSDIVSNTLVVPRIFDATTPSPLLTPFGKLFFDLKAELYQNLNHRFGTKNWTEYDEVDTASLIEKGEFASSITTLYSASDVRLKGVVYHGQGLAIQGNWSTLPNIDMDPDTPPGFSQFGGIIVPIFQHGAGVRAHPFRNSLFDDYGRLRLAWAETDAYVSNATPPRHQLIAPGQNQPFSANASWDSTTEWIAVILTAHSSVDAWPLSDLIYNLVCQSDDKSASVAGDKNNAEDQVYLGTNYNLLRPNTQLRAVKKEQDRLLRTTSSLDPQAKARLILSGRSEIHVVDSKATNSPESLIYFESESDYDFQPEFGQPNLNELTPRASTGLDTAASPSGTPVVGINVINNVDLYVYGNGERFMGVEQLTAYFPSSLLFKSPRTAIKIPKDKVPDKAKRLLIYRTKASHDNSFQPNQYGEVDVIEIARDSSDEAETELPDGTTYAGIYYFDEIKDTFLDFTQSPDQYEGMRSSLKSRFNIPLNERMYYLNFEESYQPLAPRLFKEDDIADTNAIYNTYYQTYDSEFYDVATEVAQLALTITEIGEKCIRSDEGKTYKALNTTNATMADWEEIPNENRDFSWPTGEKFVQYQYVFQDADGINSQAITTEVIDLDSHSGASDKRKVVTLHYIPSGYDASIKSCSIYRTPPADTSSVGDEYFFVGTVTAEDEGVFLDDNIAGGKLLGNTTPDIQNYESGLRWSEPFQPDWIKADSFTEYRSGDGKQITGVGSLYGNLVIFKETSIHRVAVQAKIIPISRTDEVTPEIGCVAPQTLINVDNTLYFLSWKGFMKYDGNQLTKADGAFAEELQHTIKVTGDNIRYASCAYNPHYNEIYLNIPPTPTDGQANDAQTDAGHSDMYGYQRELLGHIYIINLEKGYSTKFGYDTTKLDPDDLNKYLKYITDPIQTARLYYLNSLGELRSGDLTPSQYGTADDLATPGYTWAGIWTETPYNDGSDVYFKDTDDVFDGRLLSAGTWSDVLFETESFPRILQDPIKSIFRSKFFTGNDETTIKRVRKVLVNMFSRGDIQFNLTSIPYQALDDRIDNTHYNELGASPVEPDSEQIFNFDPTVVTTHPLTGNVSVSNGSNVLSIVPRAPYDSVIGTGPTVYQRGWEDRFGKPIRMSLEIQAELRTQINDLTLHWRQIHSHLS